MDNLKKIFLASILFTLILVLLAASMVHAVGTIATIPVGTNPEGIAYDSGKGEIFVANYGSNTVSVISDNTNTVVATVAVGKNPVSVAYDSGKGEIFVTNAGDNTVSVIADSNNTVVETLFEWGIEPQGIVYDPAKGELFAANYGSNSVSVISDNNNTVIETIAVGEKPIGVTYDSGKGEIFVANSNSPSDNSAPGTISVISDSKVTASYPGTPTSSAVVATLNIDNNGYLTYDSVKSEIFTTSSVISDNNNTVIANLNFNQVAPINLAYDSAKDVIFISGFYSYINGINVTVCAMSDSTYSIVQTWTLAIGNAYDITYDSAKGEAFVTNYDGGVFVISDSSLPSPTPTPTMSPSPTPTASASPTPTVPEFSGAGLILVVIAVVVATLCAISSALKKLNQTNSDSKQTTKQASELKKRLPFPVNYVLK